MSVRCLVLLLLLLVSGTVFASAKDDFIQAVVSQCSKSAGDAEALATSGRDGNVIKFKMCGTPTIDLGGGCAIKCSKDGSTIGN